MTDELIKVPDIGGAEGAEVVEGLVSPGENIDVEQSLVVVESDKAAMEIPAPIAGVVRELRVAVGDSVAEGDVILVLAMASGSEGADAEPDNTDREVLRLGFPGTGVSLEQICRSRAAGRSILWSSSIARGEASLQ